MADTYKVVITDCEHAHIEPETEILTGVGATVEWHDCRSEEDVIQAAGDADALIVGYASITARVLDALPDLRMISRYGSGVDMIDVDAATERGVVVANTPDYCVEEVADHTMALLLACARKVTLLDRAVRDGRAVRGGEWNTVVLAGPIHRLSNQTVGVVGLGQIGRRLVRRAQAFGLQVVAANDPAMTVSQAAELGATMVRLEELLPRVDYLSLHVPLTESTFHLIGEAEIELMKSSSFVINASRGSVIDQAALIDALEERRLAGAALDVYESEPITPDNPLCGMENVVLSSHAAWYSEEALHDVKAKTAQAVADFFEGSVPESVVNPSVLGEREDTAPSSAG